MVDRIYGKQSSPAGPALNKSRPVTLSLMDTGFWKGKTPIVSKKKQPARTVMVTMPERIPTGERLYRPWGDMNLCSRFATGRTGPDIVCHTISHGFYP